MGMRMFYEIEKSWYLLKQPKDNDRKSSEKNVIQRLEPIIVEPLTRKSSSKCKPKLSQSEGKILVEEIHDHLPRKRLLEVSKS